MAAVDTAPAAAPNVVEDSSPSAWPEHLLELVMSTVLQAPLQAESRSVQWRTEPELMVDTAVQSRLGWARSTSAALRLVCRRWRRVHDKLLPCLTLMGILNSGSIILGNRHSYRVGCYALRFEYERNPPYSSFLFEMCAGMFPNVTCLELVDVGKSENDVVDWSEKVSKGNSRHQPCDRFLCALKGTPAFAAQLTELHIHLDRDSDERTDRLAFLAKGCQAIAALPALTKLRLQGGCPYGNDCLRVLAKISTLTDLDVNFFSMETSWGSGVQNSGVIALGNMLTSLRRLKLQAPLENDVKVTAKAIRTLEHLPALCIRMKAINCGEKDVTLVSRGF